jgi:hypothetical protein
MKKVEDYRGHAGEYRALAGQSRSAEEKAMLAVIANTWDSRSPKSGKPTSLGRDDLPSLRAKPAKKIQRAPFGSIISTHRTMSEERAGAHAERRSAMMLSLEQRWALRSLADSVHGHTEAVMLAHAFTVDQLAVLVRDGLATAEPDVLAGRVVTLSAKRPARCTALVQTQRKRSRERQSSRSPQRRISGLTSHYRVGA